MLSFNDWCNLFEKNAHYAITPEPSVLGRKGEWVLLSTSGEVTGLADNLINLVQTAYKNTQLRSYINTKDDLKRSFYWEVVDIDTDPLADVVVFGRTARSQESWDGIRIQGIGHDGERISKDYALDKIKSILNTSGFWIEASGILERRLREMGVRICTQTEVESIFDNVLEYDINTGEYRRKLESGNIIVETSFGYPKFKIANVEKTS